MVTIRWDIKTIDRLSMVEDVLKEFSCCDINIISMKVTHGRILIKSGAASYRIFPVCNPV